MGNSSSHVVDEPEITRPRSGRATLDDVFETLRLLKDQTVDLLATDTEQMFELTAGMRDASDAAVREAHKVARSQGLKIHWGYEYPEVRTARKNAGDLARRKFEMNASLKGRPMLEPPFREFLIGMVDYIPTSDMDVSRCVYVMCSCFSVLDMVH